MATSLDTSLPYSIDDDERYAKSCFWCHWRIPYEKYAERMENCGFWFCSSNCIQAAVAVIGPGFCWPPEEENTTTFKEFMRQVLRKFNDKVSREALKMFTDIEKSGLTRAEVKEKALDGDAESAVIIGLTYLFRFVADRSESAMTIDPPFNKTTGFSRSKAFKYLQIAAEQDDPIALYAIATVVHIFDLRVKKDYIHAASLYYPEDDRLKQCYQNVTLGMKCLFFNTDKLQCYGLWHLLYIKDPASCLSSKYTSVIGSYPLAVFAEEVKKFKVIHLVIDIRSPSWDYLISPLNTVYKNRSEADGKGSKQDWKGTKDDIDPSLIQCHPIYICDHMSEEQIKITNKANKTAVPPAYNNCTSCTEMAITRVLAVYQNTYWLSEQHAGLYNSVIYPSSTSFQQDIFRIYSKCEIIFALEYLSRFPEELRVLRISRNPDFYWAIINYFGSIYNALLVTLGEKFTKSIYASYPPELPPVPPVVRVDMYPPDRQERLVLKCGNIHCSVLDLEFKFSRCTRCMIRRYCSKDCQVQDWKLHKLICFLRKGIVEEEKAERSRIAEEETVEDAVENLYIRDEEDDGGVD